MIYALAIAAFFTGVSKAGFSGVSYISVFLLADVFGAKASIGIALPMLIMADLIVFPTFRKYGTWRKVWPFMWPALIGMSVAVLLLSQVSNEVMRAVIGGIIISMVLMQVAKKLLPEQFKRLAHSNGFGVGAGISGGVATVLANAAGPIMQLFLLSRDIPKMEIMGVSARFFLVVNVLKLPLNAGLDLMTWETLMWNFFMLPAIAGGVWIGKRLLHRVPQKGFEYLVIVFSLAAGLKLLLS